MTETPFYTPAPVAVFALLMLAMQLKHLLADFILQSNWMARGKAGRRAWLTPLAVHAGLHGLGTTGIALVFAPTLWWFGLLDFAVHGTIDRCKALASQHWPFETTDIRYWWVIGADQFLHHTTDIILAASILILKF